LSNKHTKSLFENGKDDIQFHRLSFKMRVVEKFQDSS